MLIIWSSAEVMRISGSVVENLRDRTVSAWPGSLVLTDPLSTSNSWIDPSLEPAAINLPSGEYATFITMLPLSDFNEDSRVSSSPHDQMFTLKLWLPLAMCVPSGLKHRPHASATFASTLPSSTISLSSHFQSFKYPSNDIVASLALSRDLARDTTPSEWPSTLNPSFSSPDPLRHPFIEPSIPPETREISPSPPSTGTIHQPPSRCASSTTLDCRYSNIPNPKAQRNEAMLHHAPNPVNVLEIQIQTPPTPAHSEHPEIQ
mmetsp:Transcript_44218/g.172228  ORF Transcript_44218/g.172228 Transcript_44218/m.172228 type:complete len:261 (-) Transcript_44218:25-807(-)